MSSSPTSIWAWWRDVRPSIYGRYVDDLFIEAKDQQHLQRLCEALANNSCLNFSIECHANGSLPFLDVLVKPEVNRFVNSVYVKDTNVGRCLNAEGECPTSYKKSVIRSYVNRVFSHCSSWSLLHNELQRLQQVLVNNGFSNKDVHAVIHRKMDKYLQCDTAPTEKRSTIVLQYRSFMNTSFLQMKES